MKFVLIFGPQAVGKMTVDKSYQILQILSYFIITNIEQSEANLLSTMESYRQVRRIYMEFQTAIIIVIVLVGIVSLLTYKLGHRKYSRFLKYIPAVASLLGIGFFFIKMKFISIGYEGILDMLFIILLTITFLVSIIEAIIIDVMNKRKKY